MTALVALLVLFLFTFLATIAQSSSPGEKGEITYTPDALRDFLMPLPSPFFFTREEEEDETFSEPGSSSSSSSSSSSGRDRRRRSPSSSTSNAQKIVDKLLQNTRDEENEGFQQTSMNILRDDEKASFFYGFAESDRWYAREQIGKEEFGSGKISDTKHHVIKTKIRNTQELRFGATVVEHPDGNVEVNLGEPEKSLNAKQEALRILNEQRGAKEESMVRINSVETQEKKAAREAKRRSDAEHMKQKRREKRRARNSFENMEKFKRDAIVSGEQMGCELCDSIAIECFKELRWKYLMERNVWKNDEYAPAEKAVMSCLVHKCGGLTANPTNAMKNRAVVPVPKPVPTGDGGRNSDRDYPRDEQRFALASIELSTIRSPITQFDSYTLTTACEEAFDFQTRNDVATRIANALKDLRDRDELIRSERARRGEITSKTTKKDLLAEDVIGINAAELGCAFMCEVNEKNIDNDQLKKDLEMKKKEEAEQQCSPGFGEEEGEREDGQPSPPKCTAPEKVPPSERENEDPEITDDDEGVDDDDYEEDINSREHHDEDTSESTHSAPRFTRAQHSKARFLARGALRKLDRCHRSTQGWWTYEICFEKNITQYHAMFDYAKKRVVIDERTQSSLGVFSAMETEARLNALYDGNDEPRNDMRRDHHRLRQDHIASRYRAEGDNELRVDGYVPRDAFLPGMTKTIPAFVVAHVKGSHCDAINDHRESVVLYACSNDLQTHVKVVEQTTCKYVVVVYVKELCVFKGFQREENVLIRIVK